MTSTAGDRFSLANKTILVAGGTRGIGQAISLRCARAGAAVVANYLRNEEAARQVQSIAAEEHLSLTVCRADLTSDKGLEQLDRSLSALSSPLSGLVYCAATGIHRPMQELTERHFDFVFNLNVRAFLKVVKLVHPRLAAGSSIVAVSSMGATRVLPSYSLVGSSKGALDALARHFAVELAPDGIRVNILTAGAVLTDAWKAMPDSEHRLAETVRRTPTGRLVTAEEVAYGAQFLCSEASSGIIGQTLIFDGGAAVLA